MEGGTSTFCTHEFVFFCSFFLCREGVSLTFLSQICGLESEPLKRMLFTIYSKCLRLRFHLLITGPVAQKKLFISHLIALKRELSILRSDAVIVVDIEADYGTEAMHHETYLNEELSNHPELRDVCILWEDSGRAGVRVSSVGKEMMIRELNRKLNEETLKFYTKIVTTGKDAMGSRSDPLVRKDQLITQLRNYAWVKQAATTPHGKPKRTATGKLGGGKDDMVMALMHGCVSKMLFSSQKGHVTYKEWHHRINS